MLYIRDGSTLPQSLAGGRESAASKTGTNAAIFSNGGLKRKHKKPRFGTSVGAPAFIRAQWRAQFRGKCKAARGATRFFMRGRQDSLLHNTDLAKELLLDGTTCYFLTIGEVCYCESEYTKRFATYSNVAMLSLIFNSTYPHLTLK